MVVMRIKRRVLDLGLLRGVVGLGLRVSIIEGVKAMTLSVGLWSEYDILIEGDGMRVEGSIPLRCYRGGVHSRPCVCDDRGM